MKRNDIPFHYEQSARKRLREENFSLKSRLESLEDKYEPMKKENEALKVRVKPSLENDSRPLQAFMLATYVGLNTAGSCEEGRGGNISG